MWYCSMVALVESAYLSTLVDGQTQLLDVHFNCVTSHLGLSFVSRKPGKPITFDSMVGTT